MLFFLDLFGRKMLVLPISEIPAAIFKFTSEFDEVFNHPAQEKHFAEYLTGLIASGNRTIAGIHQRLISDTDYDSLHHFMSESPWTADDLKNKRFEWIKDNLPSAKEKPTVIAIDSTFLHHTGENIHGVYWYWDYAKKQFCLAQRLVLSTFVSPSKLIPLGHQLYHRGFLPEQKLYLEATMPASDAPEAAWTEYNDLVEKYKENCKDHKTQLQIAAELVDECEAAGFKIDAYVLDGAFLDKVLMNHISGYKKAWVCRLAKSRLLKLDKDTFISVADFAKSLPKEDYTPVRVKTRQGEERTFWCAGKNMIIKDWKKQRVGKRRETGRVLRMKESYDEGLANHIGPESCAGSRKVTREALTGVCAGWVLSPEKVYSLGCRRRLLWRKATSSMSQRQDIQEPHVVIDLKHAQKYSAREPGCPAIISTNAVGIASGSRKGMSR
jgi:DDE superfamily endonuclease